MKPLGVAGRVARAFVDSKLTPLLIAASLGLGAFALLLTPREEEPQIRVPMVDVTASWPGASPEEIESRVVAPLERAFFGISRVEHVYSTSRPGGALITVRFLVNESNEESLVKVFERLNTVAPQLPRGVPTPVVELHSIDDVPFLALTLSSDTLSAGELRPIAAELAHEISEIANTSKAYLIGGEPRMVRVLPDIDRLNASGVTLLSLISALQSEDPEDEAGTLVRDNLEVRVRASSRFSDARAVADTVVGVRGGREIAVRDVARVIDGPGDVRNTVFSISGEGSDRRERPAVTIAVAKRPGANASELAERALEKVEAVRPMLLPKDVRIDVTRNYGETAAHKSSELVEHLLIATLSVVILISLAMGWRSGLVVGIAVPVTLALTLFIYFLAGYTMNRVTLFALIFSIGILVDDAIVVVENIERHYREKPGRSLLSVAIEAVDEVGNPTMLATITVIAAILPLAFVRGLMGPYMRPIPTGASAAMLFSLAVAFVVSPWAAVRIFKSHAAPTDGATDDPHAASGGAATRLYRRVMRSLLTSGRSRIAFFSIVTVILLASMSLVGFGLVKVKMLPFDNKNEFQVLVNHDEGTPLEVTLETARRMAQELSKRPDVRNVQIYAGTAAPFNFNGLVRHYFLRQAPWGADLQVNLADKADRSAQSHDIAKEVRPVLAQIASARGARVKVIEIPPGPPVLDTLVAEIYGPDAASREALRAQVRGIFETTNSVVDIDDSTEAERSLVDVVVDRRKAGLHGARPTAITMTVAAAGAGRQVALLDAPRDREAVPVVVGLDVVDRSDLGRRLSLRVDSPAGPLALSSLTATQRASEPQPIHHKDLKPVMYVFADLAGERESPAYALADMNTRLDRLRLPDGGPLPRHAIDAPETTDRPAMKWDGEWQITYEVFRDMGIAFAVVMVLIALLVVGWFQSFSVPLAILLPIPLSLIGILPGHLMFGAFFTATSMIGFIAGAGIIVRNSIILVDFIELKLREGVALEDAVVEAGAVRFRPMLLTAAAVIVGSFVILFDPIFQGLAISLMMGEIAATLLSRIAVPVVYFLIARRGRAEALRKESL
ncbi:MAG: efflux RND transporter permease subunit [Vicinamibacteria bacterium]